MSNQLGTKPARVVSVALQEVDAIRLHAHRKEYKHPMPAIVMAGVTALEEGANPEHSWFNRLMGATCRIKTRNNYPPIFYIECMGWASWHNVGDLFEVADRFDVFEVSGKGHETIYAGTRPNCELVAEHLNKILREAEEASNE